MAGEREEGRAKEGKKEQRRRRRNGDGKAFEAEVEDLFGGRG